jgi:hypothetical protein
VERSGRQSTTKGNKGKAETPKRSKEAQLPPRGKRVSAGQVERTCFYNLTILMKSLFVFEKESFSNVPASFLPLVKSFLSYLYMFED